MANKANLILIKTPDHERDQRRTIMLTPLQKYIAAMALTVSLGFALTRDPAAPPSSPKPQTSPYTMKQLHQLPQATFTVHTGEGADNAIYAVDPQVERQNSALTRELRSYVESQATNGSPYLQDGQTVQVPVLEASKTHTLK